MTTINNNSININTETKIITASAVFMGIETSVEVREINDNGEIEISISNLEGRLAEKVRTTFPEGGEVKAIVRVYHNTLDESLVEVVDVFIKFWKGEEGFSLDLPEAVEGGIMFDLYGRTFSRLNNKQMVGGLVDMSVNYLKGKTEIKFRLYEEEEEGNVLKSRLEGLIDVMALAAEAEEWEEYSRIIKRMTVITNKIKALK